MANANNEETVDLTGLIDLERLALFAEDCIAPLVGSVASLATSVGGLVTGKADGEGIALSFTPNGGLRVTYTNDDGEDEE